MSPSHVSDRHRASRAREPTPFPSRTWLWCLRTSLTRNRLLSRGWTGRAPQWHSGRRVDALIHLLCRQEPYLLAGQGFPVGLIPGADYKDTAVKHAVGDRIIIYMDGIVEAHNLAEESTIGN